jgi:hypothetical protein
LSSPVSFKLKPIKIMGIAGKCVSRYREKYASLWIPLFLFFLVPIGMVSSGSQGMFSEEKQATAENKSRNVLPDRPVYSPLARSIHSRNASLPPEGQAALYEEAVSAPGFSWSGWAESQWWFLDSGNPQGKSIQLQGDSDWASSGIYSYQDLRPRLRHRDIDTRAIMNHFIAMGVADLLEDLRKEDLQVPTEQGDSEANPFDDALKEALREGEDLPGEEFSGEDLSSEAEPEEESNESNESKEPDPAESDPIKEEAADNDEILGIGGSPMYIKLLFIGRFDGRPLTAAVGFAPLDMLHSARDNPVYIDLAGVGRLSMDMDIVLRDRDNQESVAFGRLNDDDVPDMVVTSKTTNKARVYLGEGQGEYRISGDIFGGLGPSAVVISDFSADGSPDVAVANQVDGTIVVDGKGLRRFIFLPTSAVYTDFSSMLPFDFNEDGFQDLLLSNYQNHTAFLYMNQGKGMFAPSDSFSLELFPYLRSEIDLNRDGMEDLVYIQSLDDNFSVVMLDGADNSITNLGNMTADPSLYFVLGDFNVDGVVDVAMAHRK